VRGRRDDESNMDSTVVSSTVLGPIVVIIGVEFVVDMVRAVSGGERIVSCSDQSGTRSRVSGAGESSA